MKTSGHTTLPRTRTLGSKATAEQRGRGRKEERKVCIHFVLVSILNHCRKLVLLPWKFPLFPNDMVSK